MLYSFLGWWQSPIWWLPCIENMACQRSLLITNSQLLNGFLGSINVQINFLVQIQQQYVHSNMVWLCLICNVLELDLVSVLVWRVCPIFSLCVIRVHKYLKLWALIVDRTASAIGICSAIHSEGKTVLHSIVNSDYIRFWLFHKII